VSDELPQPGRRPLNLAFVLDPLPGLKAYKDSSIAMMRAAATRGHAVFAIDCATLAWRRPESAQPGGVFGMAAQLHMQPDNHDWFREIGRDRIPLTDFDAVVMRRDPPFDNEYLTATWLLERWAPKSVKNGAAKLYDAADTARS